jgi:hypothetical protein
MAEDRTLDAAGEPGATAVSEDVSQVVRDAVDSVKQNALVSGRVLGASRRSSIVSTCQALGPSRADRAAGRPAPSALCSRGRSIAAR